MFDNIAIGYVLLSLVRRKFQHDWEKTLAFDLTLNMRYRKLTYTQKHQVDKIRNAFSEIEGSNNEALEALFYFYALSPVIFQSAGITVEKIDGTFLDNVNLEDCKKSYTNIVNQLGTISKSLELNPRFVPSRLLN